MSSAEMSVPGFWLAQGATYNSFTCPVNSPYPCFVQYGSTIPVSGSFSATLSGFSPTAGATATLAVTTASANVALPAGADVIVTNTGANTAFIRLTVGAGTAVVTDMALVAGAAVGFHILTQTFINAITSSSTTSLNIQGGTGLATGYGGGSSSGGGSNAAASATGSAVPASGSYNALNVAGTLRGQTAANPSGVVYAAQSDITSVNGITVLTGAGATGTGSERVTVAQDTTTIAGAAPLTTGVYVTGPSAAALATSAAQTTINTNLTNIQGSKAGGTAATNSELVGGVYNTSAPTLTNGQQASNQLDVNGNLKVNIVTGASSGAVAQASTTSGQTGGLTQAAVTTAAPTYTTATTNPLSMDTAGSLRVNVTSATGVAQASTSSGQTISPIGVRTLSASPTDTTAQTNMPVANLNGALSVLPYGLPDTGVSGLTAAMTATTSTAVTGVGATSGKFNYITSLVVGNSHATVGTFVELQDGSGGTTFFTVPASAVYGGAALTFPKPLKQPTVNTALYVKCTTTGSNTIVSVVGYQAP